MQGAVALIGMAFRFPGDCHDETGFWSALMNRRDLVTEIPPDRWATSELQHPKRSEPGRSITFSAGVLSRVDEFDAGFFGISPREATWLDPQQRLLLELSWEATENAGVPPSSLAGTDCAVYVGIAALDYGTRGLDDLASLSSNLMTGNTLSVAANRLSYVYDLHGPSLAVDTACSSSLVALHHACRAIQAGEASCALVGGVNLLLHPYPFVGFTKASMLSATGRCRPFDAAADGYVRSEGGAVLLLKPYAQALADGDDIQALILASGVNADGARKTGITIPSAQGQADLMREVLARSGLKAGDVDFIEAHGTGTVVGDPIEAAAIGQVYGQAHATPLPIGSVKANVGHLEAASGMAGLVKAVLALKHRALPGAIHLEAPNPHIDFQALNLDISTQGHVLPTGGRPLVAGVNSFGFGGANAHVLLQGPATSAPQVAPAHAATPRLPPLLLSARSAPALAALAGSYAQQLVVQGSEAYNDIAYGAAFLRDRLDQALILQPASFADAVDRLQAFADGEDATAVLAEDTLPEPGGIAFVYSGNGSQWQGMACRLLDESPRFAAILAGLEPLDLVVINAGMNTHVGPCGEPEPWDEVDALLDVNLKASMRIAQAVLPAMRAQGRGQIALMSSLAGYFGLPVTPAYSASKAGVKAYGEALRGWLAPEGIRVNVIMPGYVTSPMCDAMPGPKPWLWTPERAARAIRRGLARDRARISFPFPLNWGTWWLAVLPAALSHRIVRWMGYHPNR